MILIWQLDKFILRIYVYVNHLTIVIPLYHFQEGTIELFLAFLGQSAKPSICQVVIAKLLKFTTPTLYIHTYIRIYTYVYIHVCVCVCVCVCTHLYQYAFLHDKH